MATGDYVKIYKQSYLFISVIETLAAHSMFFCYMCEYAGIPPSALFVTFRKYSNGFYGFPAD
jgi:sodium/potassium-transporting ATPase subunit alpha